MNDNYNIEIVQSLTCTYKKNPIFYLTVSSFTTDNDISWFIGITKSQYRKILKTQYKGTTVGGAKEIYFKNKEDAENAKIWIEHLLLAKYLFEKNK